MAREKKIIIVVAEGQSEVAYLNELNRYFREEEIDTVFYPVKAVNGQYREIRKAYNTVVKKNRKSRIEILVDRDIYIRDESESEGYKGRREDGLPRFRFQYMNFEDFLILHFSRHTALRWARISKEYGHDILPMTAKEYLPLMRRTHIFGAVHYRKGEIPFKITQERLDNLIRNDRSRDIYLHSDFTDVLIEILPDKSSTENKGR